MNNQRPINQKFRIAHRYLGNFLAGIMMVYAVSGIVLIFRDTDFLKKEYTIEKNIGPNVAIADLGKNLKIRGFKKTKEEGDLIYFNKGTYNKKTGDAKYTVIKLPMILNKLTHLHKAKSSDPLYWLNIFFGLALLTLAITSFWMFRPKSKIFTKGLLFTAAGIALVLIMIFLG